MWSWLNENREWLFQGAAVLIPIAIISGIWAVARSRRQESTQRKVRQQQRSGSKSTNIQAAGDVSIQMDRKPDGK